MSHFLLPFAPFAPFDARFALISLKYMTFGSSTSPLPDAFIFYSVCRFGLSIYVIAGGTV